jgi:hypothetical protein
MNRAALIDQIQETRKTLETLLTLLQSAPVERDDSFSHLYQSQRELSDVRACREVRQANRAVRHRKLPDRREHAGFKREFRQWEELLRVGD